MSRVIRSISRGEATAAAAALAILFAGAVWLTRSSLRASGPRASARHFERQAVEELSLRPPTAGLTRAALDAYNHGKYWDAETAAATVVIESRKLADPAPAHELAKARWVLAYSAARRKDLKLARERFALLRSEASQLPNKGKQEVVPGETEPTLEQEGAYQHAVLTGALALEAEGGRQKAEGLEAAEAEYLAFISPFAGMRRLFEQYQPTSAHDGRSSMSIPRAR